MVVQEPLLLQNFQDQPFALMVPVEVSVKVTVRGAVPEGGLGLVLKLATGAVMEEIVLLTSFENPLQVVLPLL